MAKLKLSYFDFHGGRGAPARIALSIGGIAFEDDRVPPPIGGVAGGHARFLYRWADRGAVECNQPLCRRTRGSQPI